jgi:hypothetical protein
MNKIQIYKESYTINDKTLTKSELEALIIAYHEYEALKIKENIHF